MELAILISIFLCASTVADIIKTKAEEIIKRLEKLEEKR